jgi:acetolactate synthase-1/2/3 large subunit
MYAAKIIATFLKFYKKSLYTYPGGTIAPIYHECKLAHVPIICAKTEQGAGFMAIAEAMFNRQSSFVAVTSGPGATNIITCIADAFYDSIPIIVITGQVGTKDLNRPDSIRQKGFQETPIVDMVKKITKATFLPQSPAELIDSLKNALNISEEGSPGPILIDLPMDVQLTDISEILHKNMLFDLRNKSGKNRLARVEKKILQEIKDTLTKASRPLILAGAGSATSYLKIRLFVEKYKIPVITSLRGLGVFPTNNILSAGWIGHTGMPWANWAFCQSDWVLVLGSRLDVRQTGTIPDQLCGKTLFYVNNEYNELKNSRVPDVTPIHSSVSALLASLQEDNFFASPDYSEWIMSINKKKREMPLQDHGKKSGVAPDELLTFIDSITENQNTAVVTGVGSHQQWAARYFSYSLPNKLFFTSAGHGTMGYALPVAIGVKRLDRDRLVICVDGDGSFQMNIQELALIRELNVPIKILIMDNGRLGIVSQFQNITFGDDPVTGNFYSPDFISIAKAYGLKSFDLPDMNEAIIMDWLNEPGPALLRAKIQHDAPVSPMLLAGQSLDNMWYAEKITRQREE